ncbi:hypothetical protein F4802DRAFT_596610 [Xylaria palmicola]|nr:hypothetical protein F4802DRAFT_596610 [Xylaria palmicola]
MLGQEWADFDARQHDARWRQEHHQSAEQSASDSPDSSTRDGTNIPTTINHIAETFHQVTLNRRGQRDVAGAAVLGGSEISRNGGTVPGQTVRAGEASGISDALHGEDVRHLDLAHSQTLSIGWPGEANGDVGPYRIRGHNTAFTRIADRVGVVEDRPEWEDSGAVYETQDGNRETHAVTEDGVGDLIEL